MQFNTIFQAHGVKGVLSMKANSKQDQLISAGKGTVYKFNMFIMILHACSTYIFYKFIRHAIYWNSVSYLCPTNLFIIILHASLYMYVAHLHITVIRPCDMICWNYESYWCQTSLFIIILRACSAYMHLLNIW